MSPAVSEKPDLRSPYAIPAANIEGPSWLVKGCKEELVIESQKEDMVATRRRRYQRKSVCCTGMKGPYAIVSTALD